MPSCCVSILTVSSTKKHVHARFLCVAPRHFLLVHITSAPCCYVRRCPRLSGPQSAPHNEDYRVLVLTLEASERWRLHLPPYLTVSLPQVPPPTVRGPLPGQVHIPLNIAIFLYLCLSNSSPNAARFTPSSGFSAGRLQTRLHPGLI